jgi:hypothetical protein
MACRVDGPAVVCYRQCISRGAGAMLMWCMTTLHSKQDGVRAQRVQGQQRNHSITLALYISDCQGPPTHPSCRSVSERDTCS